MSVNTIYHLLKDGTENYFPENSARILTTSLTDEDGNAITAASLSYLKLTLWEILTGDIINSRNAQSILNENGGSMSSNTLTLKLSADDMAVVGDRKTERHRGLIEAKLSTGDQDEEVMGFQLDIQNLEKII
jgi:hypothetical protein